MTTLLDRLLGRPQADKPKSAKAVTALGPWNNGIPLSSLNDTPQKRAAAYLAAYKVGWFHKAGRKIANDISSLDWSLSLGDAEEGDAEATLPRPALDIPFDSLSPIDQFQRLLERPNPNQTGRQLLHKTQVRLDFAGAACWYLENGAGVLPTAIYGISPARMWPSYGKDGRLIGWVMDKDSPSGGVPFDTSEILWFSTGNASDDDIWGVSVVEAVYAQVPLTDLMARHTADVLTTGGRLAGMVWPKERALTEDEFVDAQRAWRNVASDPNAARRLLIFPEPMEWASGASSPADIGIPELAVLNRDEIVTAFPISPYMLGVPAPGGLNSGEVRREDRREYWEGTIHPRADLLEETIQTGLLSRYEQVTGQTYDFELAEPNLDDAASLSLKATAFKDLVGIGLDPDESIKAVGLGHIKFLGLPAIIDPAAQQMMQEQALEAQADQPPPTKVIKSSRQERRDAVTMPAETGGRSSLARFFDEQRARVTDALRTSYPTAKSVRREWAAKADPDWWDATREDEALKSVMRGLYLQVGRGSLQVVADQLDRIVANRQVARTLEDLLRYGGERIVDINERTKAAIAREVAEGVRRGYSVNQLVDGVTDEGYAGVQRAMLDNGLPAWGDLRAETIARTETALSYNRAAITSYKEFGVQRVLAYDGDDDDVCASRDGQEFDIEEAASIEDHPNGTLDWAPIVDKSYHEPTPTVQPVTVNLTIANHAEPGKPPDVKVYNDIASPAVTVTPPDVHVTNEQPVINVKVPAQEAPVVTVPVNVESPVVRVEAAEVNVPPTVVNVAPADVKVQNTYTLPEQPAPVVNVSTPAAKAQTGPVEMRIVEMPTRVTRRKVDRDKQGRITDTTDVETDG